MLSTWALLMIAVVTEIAWGCSLKALSYYSLDRIFALVPIALTCANMYLLARVMKTLPSGLTYAVWTTLGAAGVRERQKFCVHGIIGARQTGASNEHEHQTQFS